MATFSIAKQPSGMLSLSFQQGGLQSYVVFPPEYLPALYSCVGAAMAEMSGDGKICSCGMASPICGRAFKQDQSVDIEFCCNPVVDPDSQDQRCGHDEACHQPQEPARGNEQ